LDVVGVSGAKEYSVNPAALVSTVALPMVAVFRLPPVAAAGLPLLVPPLLPLLEDVADELHAATTTAAAATASSASSIRRGFSRVSDLIIAFSFAHGPTGPLRQGDADDFAVGRHRERRPHRVLAAERLP
jgi:hypothetical protein